MPSVSLTGLGLHVSMNSCEILERSSLDICRWSPPFHRPDHHQGGMRMNRILGFRSRLVGEEWRSP